MNRQQYEAFSQRLSNREIIKNVLVLGSGPAAPKSASLVSQDTIIVALNNAHRAIPRVDVSVYADDFPDSLRHSDVARIGRSSPHYLPAISDAGGMIFCGATIAFAALYWIIRAYPCSQVSMYACDMVYQGGDTHFYGKGSPDPLRSNISLQSLEAKSLRLFYFGLKSGVLILNASGEDQTRLMFPRLTSGSSLREIYFHFLLDEISERWGRIWEKAQEALRMEQLGSIDGGRADYWFYARDPSAWDYVRRIDEKWLSLSEDVNGISRRLLELVAIDAKSDHEPQPRPECGARA